MKKIHLLLLFYGFYLNISAQTLLFDSGWKFHRGGAQGAEFIHYDDSEWRDVDLPHDWSLEDLPGTGSPFHPDAISQVSGGFTTGGTSWYRKSFSLPEGSEGKKIFILFEGIYMNAGLWINGERLGDHPYGYTSFWFDLTDFVNRNDKNILAICVKNEGQNSRWYSGSGIYRHVWLRIADPLHFDEWGVGISPRLEPESGAVIQINSCIKNETGESLEVKLITSILDENGLEACSPISTGATGSDTVFQFKQELKVENPKLWSPESPSLYKASQALYRNGELVELKETAFGIRSLEFSADKGFLLNGKPVKLKGGCVHHDNGPLGARAFDRAEERRVELLKASGFNAIRCAHNPPSPAFLEACDRLGMMVIDEAFDMWRLANNPYDYHLYFDDWWEKDIESMVYRDRNHPSVIMWSIGNEIRGMETPEVIALARMLADHIRSIEPTRPVTAAVNGLRPEKDPFFKSLDIGGYNYASGGDHNQGSMYPIDHKRVPDRVMVGTESYPLEAFNAWMDVLDNDYLIGDFVWTAFDYIGEASIGWRGYWQESSFYPWNLAWCGDIDICGWKRPQSFYRDALWKENQLSVFVSPPVPSFPLNHDRQYWSKWHWHDVVDDWTWPGMEGRDFEVTVYSSCEEAEVFLNGKSLGKKETNRSNGFTATWTVPYKAGELKAVGYSKKKKTAESALRSAGESYTAAVIPDRQIIKADGQDLSFITVELRDEQGIRNPRDERILNFEIEGEGSIIAAGNANPVSLESYSLPCRKAWRGKCLVVVRSTTTPGPIILKVHPEGLNPSRVILKSE